MMEENPVSEQSVMTFGEHLEDLRKMLFRILALVAVLAVAIFCFKEETFGILLAPRSSGFITFRCISDIAGVLGWNFHFDDYNFQLINTELASQFMTHLSTSVILAALLASPYILFEIFRFVSPALYESERRYSVLTAVIIYALFLVGLLMCYFVIFPISFRFLASYQVDASVVNTITLDSYISTFTTLTFMMGIVFELPVIVYVLGRMGFLDAPMLKRGRPYALVAIMVLAAIITPPDIFTLIMVAIPLYLLYEVSILTLPAR